MGINCGDTVRAVTEKLCFNIWCKTKFQAVYSFLV